ncbi:DeoR/GlpR family DNA-binding transcription regulator [Planococcus sp. ISL-109]|uniref:DeoR/GlpR family DNA-binding transcription regulator n=1 Tax=Planococcus sp. ISL-109 TaxID=2819166 RepID=UPI001BE9EA9D|nr:DeoR/GlpR family DNA-binding transcription regulator [Planococcus sp. ISL-109]MBT2582179.1 DeoR/GlpR transcriptional regulator [Planococcus sp. ISL-109]
MLTTERHKLILTLLKEKQSIKIQDLVELTAASESTIRRDLTELEELQKLERVFGGARVIDPNLPEPSIIDKAAKNLKEKQIIARYASSLVKTGDAIFLDAGTTTSQMIPFLKGKNVTVVTNGLSHLEALLEQGITSYLTGGFIKSRTGALVGPQTIQSLENYRFDKSFLGVNGIHLINGFTTPDPEEAAVKRMACELSRSCFVLADQSKYGKVSFAHIMDLSRSALIIDELPKDAVDDIELKTTIKVVAQ